MLDMIGKILRSPLLLLLAVAACSAPTTSPSSTALAPQQTPQPVTAIPKALTIGITSTVQAFSIAGNSTSTGGWQSITEIHSEGLVSADVSSRKAVGRLASTVPSTEDSSIAFLPDGRERVEFHLRPGITWQDGEPFSARDLVFSYQIGGPGGMPSDINRAIPYIDSVEAPDDSTFVVIYAQPYYQGATLGPWALWPLPQHLLGAAYQRYLDTKDLKELSQNPYWTSGYVNLGPFRLSAFDPGTELTFQAYDAYFLGHPKLSTIHVRVFGNEEPLYTSVLAGAVDMVPDSTIRAELGSQLQKQWAASGAGVVYVQQGGLHRPSPQLRPDIQAEPAMLDPRVRAALYRGMDRETLSDAVNGGNPQLAAYAILPQSDALEPVVRDTLRVFSYDPDTARAMLRDLGWVAAADGTLHSASDGRQLHTQMWNITGLEREAAGYAAAFRSLGLVVDEHTFSPEETRDKQVRIQYPGWDAGSAGSITRMLESPAASAQNNYTGNTNGFEDAQAKRLVQAFEAAIEPQTQAQTMRALNEYFVSTLPALPTFYVAGYIVQGKGALAFTQADVSGGVEDIVTAAYGSLSRNALTWDVQ